MQRLQCLTMLIVTFICDMCSTEYKCVYGIKDERSYKQTKKGKFYNEDILKVLFTHLCRELKNMPADMDCNKKKKRCSDLSWISSHPGTFTFYYQSDCFLSYNTMHTRIFYIETSSVMFKYLTQLTKYVQ